MVKNLRKLIEQVAKEKNIPEWLVEKALKNSIALAIKKDRKIKNHVEVELAEDEIKVYILHKGERVPIDIVPEEMNRIAAYAAKEEFLKELERADEERRYLEFIELEGEIVIGIVRRIAENGDLIVDLGKVMAILPKREQIPKETYKVGDRLKALLLRVVRRKGSYEIILSRTHPNFLRKLLEAEVSEIKEGEVDILNIVREPGERAKVLVRSKDARVDPVGIVVGLKGSKIAPITKELSGERIDVIRATENTEELVRKSLAPAPVVDIRMDPKLKKVEVAVPKDKLSVAIGKRGLNVKLANKITGWYIDVMSEEDFRKLSQMR
ncbi:transcription termination factor NusA [Thermocrinis sp.]